MYNWRSAAVTICHLFIIALIFIIHNTGNALYLKESLYYINLYGQWTIFFIITFIIDIIIINYFDFDELFCI